MKSLHFFPLIIGVCSFVLFTSNTPTSSSATGPVVAAATGPPLIAATVPLSRYYLAGKDVAEDSKTQFGSQLSKDGYGFVGTYGYVFSDIITLRNWMRLNPLKKSRFAKASPFKAHQSRTPNSTVSQPAVFSKDPPNKPTSSTSSSSNSSTLTLNISQQHYELLISYYNKSTGDYRAAVISQAPAASAGYTVKKTLGYVITPDGYDLLTALNPSGRLRAELAPIYQFYHPVKKDWMLVVSGGDFQHAYAEGYQKRGMIGYMAMERGQPISCDEDTSACIGAGEYETFRSRKTRRCYCKLFSPK